MNRAKLKSPLLITALCLSAGMSGANALELKEGKWGITTETDVPMTAEPMVQYTEECIAEDFDPLAEMFEQEMEGCEVLTSDDSATSLELTMACTIPGAGTMNGEVSFVVAGESATGQMDMTMDMGGMKMEMSSNWKGEYLGACSE